VSLQVFTRECLPDIFSYRHLLKFGRLGCSGLSYR